TKHPELSLLVPSQPVRTKQAMAIVVNSRDWPPVLHGRAHNPVNIGHTLPVPESSLTPSDYSSETINPKQFITQ
ncbi:MAG TPA: hypothetical protein VG297_08565, partial [Bryobacteraceae bacterium]|nr:hypothetical protein [Bryobacteraceae bacterium]